MITLWMLLKCVMFSSIIVTSYVRSHASKIAAVRGEAYWRVERAYPTAGAIFGIYTDGAFWPRERPCATRELPATCMCLLYGRLANARPRRDGLDMTSQ